MTSFSDSGSRQNQHIQTNTVRTLNVFTWVHTTKCSFNSFWSQNVTLFNSNQCYFFSSPVVLDINSLRASFLNYSSDTLLKLQGVTIALMKRKGCLESTFSRDVVRLAPSCRFTDTNTVHLEKHTRSAERFILAVLSTCTSHLLHRTAVR